MVFHNIFSVGIGGEGVVKSLLNALEHPQWQLVLQRLAKIGSNFEESFLWFKLIFLLRPLPLAPLLLVEVLWLLIVDELLKQLLVVLLEEVKKVALSLLRNVFSTLRVDSIHCHQHPLILTPLLCPSTPLHLEPMT